LGSGKQARAGKMPCRSSTSAGDFAVIRRTFLAALAAVLWTSAQAQIPAAIATSGKHVVAQFHAEGAQIYQCGPDAAGKLDWRFREPIATLLADGMTVGRHYAGPSWELLDGGAVVGKSVASSPGASLEDIAWLRLDAIAHHGAGRLSTVSAIQRINTKGGVAPKGCVTAGSFLSVPYSADYVFLGDD
jgi:hypothetical protein